MLPDLMQRFGVPGVAVGLLSNGAEDITTYGVTSIDNPLPVLPTTLFQIGSITKTITATALMRLVEQGRVDLDAPIRRYLPDFRLSDADVTERATLRHVVTHTGGWVGDDFTDTGNGDDALQRYVGGLAELPQITPLGELFSYCNSGFGAAGRVLEVLCGKTYEEAVTELVLRPLGMEHSFFSPSWIMTHRFAVGHLSPFEPDGEVSVARPWALPRASNAAGGVTSCLPDLLRYARFVMGDGPPGFLSDELRIQMQTPRASTSNASDSVGVAWMLREVDGTRVVAHGGGTHGQTSTFNVLPSRGFAFVVLTNSSRGGELITELSAELLRQHVGLETRVPEPVDLPPEQLLEYAGHYDAWLRSADVSVDDTRLQLRMHLKPGFPFKDTPRPPDPPPASFAYCGSDMIVGLDGAWKNARLDFIRDNQGRVVWLRIGSRLARRE